MTQTPDTTQSSAAEVEQRETSRVEQEPTLAVGDKLVPVSEAIRYRKRAQTAEQQFEQLNHELQDVRTQLSEARQTITSLERRQQADALLMDADTIDLEAARLLTEQAVLSMDEPDVRLAVQDLKRHKPYLFRRRIEVQGSAMAPAIQSPGDDPAELAAQDAARSGDRRELLRYLRLRRRR